MSTEETKTEETNTETNDEVFIPHNTVVKNFGVVITGWAPGLNKFAMANRLRGYGGWDMKETFNTLLAGGEVNIPLGSEKEMNALIKEIEQLGGSARTTRVVSILSWRALPDIGQRDPKMWQAKLVNGVRESVEIRRNNMVIVVSLGEGFNYKKYTPEDTQGVHVHLASAGAQQFTLTEWGELHLAVHEAKERLQSLEQKRESSKTTNT